MIGSRNPPLSHPTAEVNGAEVAGIDVLRIRENPKKSKAQIIEECDAEINERVEAQYAAMRDPAVREATERALAATPEEMGRAAVRAAELEHARELAVLERARKILEAWYWEAVDIRRHPTSIPPDEKLAAERRYQDLFMALDTIPSMCPLAESLQSPSALVREALLLALAEIAR